MMDLSILLGLLPFFVHGRSTICTTVSLTSVVMQSDLRYLLLGRRFLCSHATATDPHNPGLQFSNILKTLSVAVQTARAKCVIIARDHLTLDTAPLAPFINGLLPVPPPVRLTLPIVHVRYDALTPSPLHPAPPTAHLPPVPHFLPLPQRHPHPLTTGDTSRVPVVM